jgi:hypothetical protein
MKVLDKFPDKTRRAKKVRAPDTISPEELQEGCFAFRQRERRDAMYKTVTFLVKHFWGKPTEVAEGLGVLLCVWNHAFYRNGHVATVLPARSRPVIRGNLDRAPD